MQIYNQDNQIKLVHTIATSSTLISSLTAEMKKFILSKFPKDYFKHIYVDTSLVSNQTNLNRKYNQNLDKVQYPSLTITPEITLDNPVNYMMTNPHTSSPHIFLRKDLRNNYFKILVDPKNKLSLYYTCDYVTVNFNVKIATRTFIQNADLILHSRNELYPDMYLYVNNCNMNTEIPKTFVYIISSILGNKYSQESPAGEDRLEKYLFDSSVSYDRSIIKKINGGTGKPGFFMNDESNVLTKIDSLDAPGSIIRNGQTEGEYFMTFRLQASVYLANNFILSIDENKYDKLCDDKTFVQKIKELSKEEQDSGIFTTAVTSIVLRRQDTVNFNDKKGNEHLGVNVTHEVLRYDINNKKRIINLTQFLKKDVLDIHSYMVAKNLDLSSLMYIRANASNNSEDFPLKIDLENLVIELNNVYTDVIFDIFIDKSVYDTVLYAKENDDFKFGDNFLSTLAIGIYDHDELKTEQAIINSFESEKDMYSTINSDNIVRVKTMYGIGYLLLKDEDDENGSDVKICIGKDRYGNNIIKRLVLMDEKN